MMSTPRFIKLNMRFHSLVTVVMILLSLHLCNRLVPSITLSAAATPLYACPPLNYTLLSSSNGTDKSNDTVPVCCPSHNAAVTNATTRYDASTGLCYPAYCDMPNYRKCSQVAGSRCCQIGTFCWSYGDAEPLSCSVTPSTVPTDIPLGRFITQPPESPINATDISLHCDDSSCAHGGRCQPTWDGFTCLCTDDTAFSGETCDIFVCPVGLNCLSQPLYNSSAYLSEPCGEGFYCPRNTSIWTQPPIVCPQQYYCPLNSSAPILCAAGFTCGSTGLSSPAICPIGSYCPLGALAPLPCLYAEHCPIAGMSTFSVPHWTCPVGSEIMDPTASHPHCCPSNYGIQYEDGMCRVASCDGANQYRCHGFLIPSTWKYCCPSTLSCYVWTADSSPAFCADIYGRNSQPFSAYVNFTQPATVAVDSSLNCFAPEIDEPNCQHNSTCNPSFTGYSCSCPSDPAFSGKNCTFACPAGRECLSIPQRNSSQYDWRDCQPGFYCRGNGTQPVACTNGMDCSSPGTTAALLCASGSYCPTPLSRMVCPSGFYCPRTGMTSPLACSAGSDCSANGTIAQQPCAAGGYCPTPSQRIPCVNNGTLCYSNSTAPIPCGAGYYCPTWSTRNKCAPGDVCPFATMTASQRCPIGYYCPGYATIAPIPCSSALGHSCIQQGLQQPVFCPVSFYCPNITSPHLRCTVGSYCPTGSNSTQPCAIGYYCSSPSIRTACITGQLCDRVGLDAPLSCPLGSVCQKGIATVCDEGFYCDSKHTSPVSCPEQYFCPRNTSVPNPCPIGSYCPFQSAAAIPCPPGGLCSSPLQSSWHDCPANSFCEGSTSAPTSCPDGTYSRIGATSSKDCKEPCRNFWKYGSINAKDPWNCRHWTPSAIAIFVILPIIFLLFVATIIIIRRRHLRIRQQKIEQEQIVQMEHRQQLQLDGGGLQSPPFNQQSHVEMSPVNVHLMQPKPTGVAAAVLPPPSGSMQMQIVNVAENDPPPAFSAFIAESPLPAALYPSGPNVAVSFYSGAGASSFSPWMSSSPLSLPASDEPPPPPYSEY